MRLMNVGILLIKDHPTQLFEMLCVLEQVYQQLLTTITYLNTYGPISFSLGFSVPIANSCGFVMFHKYNLYVNFCLDSCFHLT